MGYLYLTNEGKTEYYLEISENNAYNFYWKAEGYVKNGEMFFANFFAGNGSADDAKAKLLEVAKDQTIKYIGKAEASREDVIEFVKKKRAERMENLKMKAKHMERRSELKHQACEILINKRIEQGGGVLESNSSNIYLLLELLNTQNWGGWELPKMTIGYSCAQYDCDGKTATTIKLDEPIEYNEKMVSKFEIGAPHGHIMGYVKIRCEKTADEIAAAMKEF